MSPIVHVVTTPFSTRFSSCGFGGEQVSGLGFTEYVYLPLPTLVARARQKSVQFIRTRLDNALGVAHNMDGKKEGARTEGGLSGASRQGGSPGQTSGGAAGQFTLPAGYVLPLSAVTVASE